MRVDSSIFNSCKWCNGGGREPDGHYPCPDCEGTGMKGGKYAEQHFDDYIEKMMKLSES